MKEDASGRRQRAVMATDAEWDRIGRAAAESGMDLSRFVIHRALDWDPLPPEVLRRAVREMLVLARLPESEGRKSAHRRAHRHRPVVRGVVQGRQGAQGRAELTAAVLGESDEVNGDAREVTVGARPRGATLKEEATVSVNAMCRAACTGMSCGRIGPIRLDVWGDLWGRHRQ